MKIKLLKTLTEDQLVMVANHETLAEEVEALKKLIVVGAVHSMEAMEFVKLKS